MRRSRPSSFLVPVFPAHVRLLPENPNRTAYCIQNMDPANSVFVSPSETVTAAAGDFQGQEIVARGFVSDSEDQGEVHATALIASRVTVQETIIIEESKPPRNEPVTHNSPREPGRFGSRTPFRSDARRM